MFGTNSIWSAHRKAVLSLTFNTERSQLLMIHKKTGLGAGKINMPGGGIESGETAAQAASREIEEETGLSCGGFSHRGLLRFWFSDGMQLEGHVMVSDEQPVGSMCETFEADPFWQDVKTIPWSDMWDDDKYWLPLILENLYLVADFFVHEELAARFSVQTFQDQTEFMGYLLDSP